MPDSVSIRTLRDFVEHRQGIWAACSNYFRCSHFATLRDEMLVQRLSWDFEPVRDRGILVSRLVCPKCGKRFPEIRHVYIDALWGVPAPNVPGPAVKFEESVRLSVEFARLHPADPVQGRSVASNCPCSPRIFMGVST